jgi:hypothetical protein
VCLGELQVILEDGTPCHLNSRDEVLEFGILALHAASLRHRQPHARREQVCASKVLVGAQRLVSNIDDAIPVRGVVGEVRASQLLLISDVAEHCVHLHDVVTEVVGIAIKGVPMFDLASVDPAPIHLNGEGDDPDGIPDVGSGPF